MLEALSHSTPYLSFSLKSSYMATTGAVFLDDSVHISWTFLSSGKSDSTNGYAPKSIDLYLISSFTAVHLLLVALSSTISATLKSVRSFFISLVHELI